jgi:hypothetical protein
MSEDLATWEELGPLKHQFPTSHAWGQTGVQGGENVITEASGESKTASGPATMVGPGEPTLGLASCKQATPVCYGRVKSQ